MESRTESTAARMARIRSPHYATNANDRPTPYQLTAAAPDILPSSPDSPGWVTSAADGESGARACQFDDQGRKRRHQCSQCAIATTSSRRSLHENNRAL